MAEEANTNHLPVHCPICTTCLHEYVQVSREHLPALFPRRHVFRIQVPTDEPLAYMESKLFKVAAKVQVLMIVFETASVAVGFGQDQAQQSATEQDAVSRARAIAEEILHILQPLAFVRMTLPGEIMGHFVAQPPLDAYQETLQIMHAASALVAGLQRVLEACPHYEPLV